MEIVFLAVLMGCSDDLSVCDTVAERQVVAASAEACEERVLGGEESRELDYPTALVQCRAADEPPLLVARAD